MRRNPDIGVTDDVVLPVVGECDDSRLNDARGRHVTERDVLSALDGAREGKMAEGTVGAGTGMVAYGFKGGIGTASRVVGDYTVGALVNANQGVRPDLMINGAHVGVEIPDEVVPAVPGTAHSIIMVVATSAPLDSRQLSRVTKRAVLGLARTGSTGHHGSGDFALAFSTADRIPRAPTSPTRTTTVLSDNDINPISRPRRRPSRRPSSTLSSRRPRWLAATGRRHTRSRSTSCARCYTAEASESHAIEA
jgi:D-aminopeptidase